MYSKKNLIVLLVMLLAIGWVLAWYQYFTTRPEKSVTQTDATAKITTNNEMTGSRDLWQIRLHGAETLDIQNASIEDNGQQSIFVPKNLSGEEAISAIKNRLQKSQQNNDREAISIKQATISSDNDRIVIRNGTNLLPYITTNDSDITSSWSDLFVEAHSPTSGYANSFLIIKNTNPTNYSISDNNDWFSAGVFFIPKDEYTILKITRNNTIDYVDITYEKWDNDKIRIPLMKAIQWWWRERWYERNHSFLRQMTNLPAETTFAFWIDYGDPLANSSVYLVAFGETNEAQQKAFFSSIEEHENDGISAQLERILTNNKKGITSFTKLETNGKATTFKTTKDTEQGIIIVNNAFAQVFPIKTDTPFSAKQEDEWREWNPYIKRITATYPIDKKSISDWLNKILWSGAWENNDIYGNNFSFAYKIQPKKTYKWDIVVKSIFGNSFTLPISLYIENIDPKVVIEQVLSNTTINILPTDWSFQDVLIQTKNAPKTLVEFQACTINTKIDTSKKQWSALENNLFTCDGEVFKKEVTIKDFVYWKAYRTAVSLPDNFPKDVHAFKVSLPDAKFNPMVVNNTVQYFYKSDIGIWTKVAKEQLYVWWFTFADNKPITQWTITVTDMDWVEVAKQPIKDGKTILPIIESRKPLLLQLSNGTQNAFVVVNPTGYWSYYESTRDSYTDRKINSYLDPSDITTTNANISFRGGDQTEKIYWYTDKALYKEGETIYFAWFVRDLTNFTSLDYLSGKTVSVTISDTQGNQFYTKNNIPLDEFGGFKGNAPIPEKISLGDAIVRYSFDANSRPSFSQNIKIKEYQKPTFFADISYENKGDMTNLVVNPQYYFWQKLSNYDIKIDWSVVGRNACYWCWRESTDTYYYNTVFNSAAPYTWGNLELYKNSETISIPLFSQSLLQQKWYQYTLQATVIVRDRNSDEVQFFTKYLDFNPIVKIGLDGNPFDRLYNDGWKDTRKWYKINGEIAEGKGEIKNITYEVYYYSYDTTTEQWVDWSTYYINGTNYTQLLKKNIGTASKFSINTDFIKNPWTYFIRAFATDKNDTIIGEVQKQIDYYDSTQGNDGMLGSLPNNYALSVNIPKKIYEEWEKIPIDIEPYQKGATVILTVERWNRVLDTIEKTLDGSQLSIEAKKWYAPNVVVNVMQIVGTDQAKEPRKEPRFFAGYAQADISTAMHELQIELKTDKETYKPWEEVSLTITTQNNKWEAIHARISLGVIDKALLGLYDNIKEPIPYFFNKLGTNIKNFTNMKLLYQSLKAFANNGSKWWGGNGWQGMFSMIRDDLADVAFRRGGIVVTWGKTTVTFTLPDNITTWTIDAIGITKDTRIGTTRKDIVAKKDLVIEANAPLFMTLGDSLEVPVKVLVSPDVLKDAKKITGTAKLINDQWDSIDLGKFSTEPNSRLLIPVKLPDNWANTHFVKLAIAWSFAKEEDSIEQIIPVRTNGLVAKDSAWFINTAGEHTFILPAFNNATATLSLSTLPTNMIDPIIDATNFEAYNYPLTEQLASQIATLSLAKQLIAKGMFTSKLINDDNVITQDGEKSIATIINNNIAKIISRQNTDWSIKWRDYGGNDLGQSTDKYMLTAYVYGVLIASRDWYEAPAQLDKTIKKTEEYLRNYRTSSDIAFLRYLTKKVQAGNTFTEQEKITLNKMNPLKTPYGGILRYAIATYQNDTEAMQNRKKYATVPTNEDRTATSLFINQTTALLLKTDALLKDPHSTQTERMEWLQNMIKLRNKQGNRTTSNANAQAMITLSHLNQSNRPTKDRISCEVTVAGKKDNITVTASGNIVSHELKDTTTTTKWSCDSAIVADAIVSFLPKNLEELGGANQHVQQMKYSIAKPDSEVWESTEMLASFSTDLAGEQVGVNIYLPATFKILDNTTTKNSTIFGESMRMPYFWPTMPFQVSDHACIPNHWETRFDRLFLYYNTLPPITCDISIALLKAYNGTTTIMPMTVSELYKGAVNGRKVIMQ